MQRFEDRSCREEIRLAPGLADPPPTKSQHWDTQNQVLDVYKEPLSFCLVFQLKDVPIVLVPCVDPTSLVSTPLKPGDMLRTRVFTSYPVT